MHGLNSLKCVSDQLQSFIGKTELTKIENKSAISVEQWSDRSA